MKRLLITLLISTIGLSIVLSCSNSSAHGTGFLDSSLHKPHLVMALFDTGTQGKPKFKLDVIYRVVKDTLKFIPVDETTFKKKLLKDTSYFFLYTGSFEDKTGRKVKSRSGGDSLRTWWTGIDKHRIVIDGGKIDSAIRKYRP